AIATIATREICTFSVKYTTDEANEQHDRHDGRRNEKQEDQPVGHGSLSVLAPKAPRTHKLGPRPRMYIWNDNNSSTGGRLPVLRKGNKIAFKHGRYIPEIGEGKMRCAQQRDRQRHGRAQAA